MPRVAPRNEEVEYPALPPRRESVLATSIEEESTQPLPWELAVDDFKALSDRGVAEGLRAMNNVYQDYLKLIADFGSLREQLKKTIRENASASARVEEAESQYDDMAEELKEAKRKQEHAERLLEVVLRQVRAESPTAAKRSTKLPDPPVFTDGKEITIDHWSQKMRAKLAANADHYPTEELKMAYLASRVEGTANLHLAPRLRYTAANKFQTAEEMLEALERVFGDPHRRQTAMASFRKLYQGTKDFNTFWSEFQRLAAELEIIAPDYLLEEFRERVSTELKKAMVTVDIPNVYELAKRCQEWDRRIQQNKTAEARVSKFRPAAAVTPAGPATGTVERLAADVRSATSPVRFPATPMQREQTPERGRLIEERRCFRCKRLGHLASVYPDRAPKTPVVSMVEEVSEPGKE